MRAAISMIPTVGGALDHLLFDKADAVRLKNIETAFSALSDQLNKLGQEAIDKSWFESEEALATIKVMADKISYEPDKPKVNALGRIVAMCGTFQHSQDHRKLSVVEHLSRLSAVQMKILSAISKTARNQKKVSNSGFEQTATAIWLDDIKTTLETGTQFWEGKLELVEELEVLESFNTIRRVQLFGHQEFGFILSSIGRQAVSYVQSAGI